MNTTGRNYKREQANESADRKAGRAARNRARLKMLKHLTAKHGEAVAKRMMEGKDVGHKKAHALGGGINIGNLKLQDPKKNQSDKRGLFDGKRTTRPKNPRRD
jgi:hypothetical protein